MVACRRGRRVLGRAPLAPQEEEGYSGGDEADEGYGADGYADPRAGGEAAPCGGLLGYGVEGFGGVGGFFLEGGGACTGGGAGAGGGGRAGGRFCGGHDLGDYDGGRDGDFCACEGLVEEDTAVFERGALEKELGIELWYREGGEGRKRTSAQQYPACVPL